MVRHHTWMIQLAQCGYLKLSGRTRRFIARVNHNLLQAVVLLVTLVANEVHRAVAACTDAIKDSIILQLWLRM